MNESFSRLIIFLLAGIISIILLTVKFRVHPFFALVIACFVTGLGLQIPVGEILSLIRNGFGDVMSKLAIIIVLGTTIGVLLEKNGSTQVMAAAILKFVGEKNSSLALSFTGFIVGLPIFCDSGYIVLNGINKSLIKRTGIAAATMSISLASGLYAVHCLIPPHPGATAAAGALGVDFGKLILYGIVIAVPAMLIGHWWAVFAGKKTETAIEPSEEAKEKRLTGPKIIPAFLPVLVPILLMALRSVLVFEKEQTGVLVEAINIAGDPSVALAIGVVLAIVTGKNSRHSLALQLSAAVEKAGGILIIIGAGGAFGAVLAATNIGDHFSEKLDLKLLGIFFPFLLTSLIKTAQGSSTVAIITASSIVLPLLPILGLDSENGKMLAVLAMGAGSMMISHSNDAYFWVISKFSDIDTRTMLRVHSVASILMGLVTMVAIYLFSLILL
ncbi:MAG TPA: GntP family permease [Chitinophagaceae bacterium]|nr:GntP family permease [Chitinophagaceae bacterium]